MQLRAILIVLLIGAVYLHECEAAPKLGLIKAKIALVKAPHIIAKVAVAKEVKAKTKLALATSWAAAKATKLAVLSAITAPFRVAKKTIALKIAGLKAAKAVKAAKIAKAANILNNLKKSPIILPVPVAVPVHSLHSMHSLKSFKSAPMPHLFNIPLPSLATSIGPIKQIISGAQKKAFQTASYKISALSALTNNANVANSVPATTLAPVHRVVPSVVDLNNAQSEIPPVPTNAYGLPPAGPIASSYGVPNES